MINHKLIGVRRRMRFNLGCEVPSIGATGGLCLRWNNLIEVQVLFSSKYIIHIRIRDGCNNSWSHATWVMATSTERRNEGSGIVFRMSWGLRITHGFAGNEDL